MCDLEWPPNVIQGVLCWFWRQMRPRRRIDKVAVFSVHKRSNVALLYKKAMLSQGEPRDAAVNVDTYRILQ